jgi:LacI family transcriptional regulator
LKFPRVLVDHVACARLAAEHFLTRGFKNFAFYSDRENWAYEENGRAFVRAVSETGHPCNWLRWHHSPEFSTDRLQWKLKRKWLATELKRAPKPLAIFATTDNHALEVLETCEDLGLSTPEQICLIGMDNSLLAVEAMHTPISSINPNMELVGYRGAALLDQMMQGKRMPLEPVRIPPLGLVMRKSSDLLAVDHPGIARSLRFLWEHYQEPIAVTDLARVAAMSMRSFHQAFAAHVGRPPGYEIQRIRIEHAKQLLATSSEKIEAVAVLCGYESANSFWVAFKRAARMTPKQYREQVGAAGPARSGE